jgi:hypothetical protein
MHSKQSISEARQQEIKQIIKQNYNKKRESVNLGTQLSYVMFSSVILILDGCSPTPKLVKFKIIILM